MQIRTTVPITQPNMEPQVQYKEVLICREKKKGKIQLNCSTSANPIQSNPNNGNDNDDNDDDANPEKNPM